MGKNKDKEWPWPSQPMNWIEGMHMENERKKHLRSAMIPKDNSVKDMILRVFVYLIFIPSMSVLFWYGLYKLVMWVIS